MQNRIVKLSRPLKQCIVAGADIVMSVLATWSAFSLRLDVLHWPSGYQWHVYQMAPLIATPIFIRLGLYRAVFRYTGLSAMMAIAKAVALYGAVLFCILLWLGLPDVPRSVGLLQPLLLLIMVGSSRALARFWINHIVGNQRVKKDTKLLIYGAGAVGAQIAGALTQHSQSMLIGFVDDDGELQGKTINGQQVYKPGDIGGLISQYAVTDIVLALPSLNRARRNEILASLRKYQVHVRSLPDLNDLAYGTVTVSDIKELDIVDLLWREPVPPNLELIARHMSGTTVLVSAAGGSIGSELCPQIILARPARLLLLEHNEFSLYAIHRELEAKIEDSGQKIELVALLGSVRDYRRVTEICNTWKPSTVYHAAAYKHVPLVEHNPVEGILNNVFGTYTLARAATESGVGDFVLISTDKAVRPTNIMGATKRLAEMILQALATSEYVVFGLDEKPSAVVTNRTRFSMVRFGNVLGSSGSVIPLFRQQLKDGGPITVTDLNVTRYFMTIPEAAQLVVQAAAMADGGDVFVLDMGEPVKIIDLALRMIRLSGLAVKDENNPHGDIEIKITGLRPGEKLYEELLIGESPQSTMHARIMKAHENFLPWDLLTKELNRLFDAADRNDIETISKLLVSLVAGYVPACGVVDHVYVAEVYEGTR